MPSLHPVSRVRSRVGPGMRQRIAAIAALAAGGLSLLMLVVLIVSQPLFSIVMLAVAVLFLASSVAALTSSGATRTVLAVIAGLLALVELVLVVTWGPSRGLDAWTGPLALALLVASSVLGRYAIVIPPPAPATPPAGRPAGRVRRRAVLFVNPRSGGGKAEDFDLVDRARELGIHTVVLTEDDDLVAMAAEAAAGEAEVIGVAGGDGSQACVLAAAAEHGIPFVCVPSGTRNHLALDLGLDRRDPGQSLAAFVDGDLRRIDYGTVNGRVFVNNVALGLYAAITDRDGYRDAKLQTVLEMVPELADAPGPWFDLRFEVPGEGVRTSSTLLLVSNNPYDVAGGSIRRRSLDSGQLGVVALEAEGVREIVGLTLAVAARRPDAHRGLTRWEATHLEVGSPHPQIVAGIDGEAVTLDQPLTFAIVAGGVQVLVPQGTRVGLDEQQAGRGPGLAGLFEVALGLPEWWTGGDQPTSAD